jgi:putative ABC transport system ATP-binding protein
MAVMPAAIPVMPALVARGLSVTRPGDHGPIRVLDAVDLTLEAGTLTDIVGPSGSGKTTLLLSLSRLLPGVEGDLSLAGTPAAGIEPVVWRTRVAYLPQRSALLSGTVLDNLLLPWRLKVRAAAAAPSPERLRAALDRVQMRDVALDRPSTRLSEGQCARVALLRTVLTRPEVLLLDEPDASLDNESAEQVGSLTSEFVDGGGAVVRVRHLRSDQRADRRLHLEAGRLTEAS